LAALQGRRNTARLSSHAYRIWTSPPRISWLATAPSNSLSR
jgi:hypothetical protein